MTSPLWAEVAGPGWVLGVPRKKDPQVGLARAIRKRRAELDLTQKELAVRCGMKVSAVSRLESDESNPSWGTMRRVAKGLETSIETIAEVSEDLERRLRSARR